MHLQNLTNYIILGVSSENLQNGTSLPVLLRPFLFLLLVLP